MKYCRHFYVAGRVQGVAFRAHACTEAQRRGVTGWVRNLADGRVEVLACGESAAVAAFEQWLWQGPRHARVDQVVASDAALEAFEQFEIRG
jgi:acylphosphatase